MTALENALFNALEEFRSIAKVEGCPDKTCRVCTNNARVMNKVLRTIAIYKRRKETEDNGRQKSKATE